MTQDFFKGKEGKNLKYYSFENIICFTNYVDKIGGWFCNCINKYLTSK